MQPEPPSPSIVMVLLPLLVPFTAIVLAVVVWLLVRPRRLREGERVSVWTGGERLGAVVVGGTRAVVWVRYPSGAEAEVPRAAVKPEP